MAAAAVLSSPLMPWSESSGMQMAQQVMDGELLLRALKSDEPLAALQTLSGCLTDHGDCSLTRHLSWAKGAVKRIQKELNGKPGLDWLDLARIVTPLDCLDSREDTTYTIEGVTVWNESFEPWRSVRHLFVLGFDESRYPGRLPRSPDFSDGEWRAIGEHLGIAVDSPSDRLERRRELFRRQLRAASDSVTFMLPHMTPSGAIATPSDSLAFMERLFARGKDAPSLVVDLDNSDTLDSIRFLAKAPPAKSQSPRMFFSNKKYLDLGRRDLLWMSFDGKTHDSLSPSSLEQLLVSPLAWLLRRLDALPRTWAPESATPAVTGALVHGVLSRLFPTGKPPQQKRGLDEMRLAVESVLTDVAIQYAPFLLSPQWRIERRSLARQVAKAAHEWQGVLEALAPIWIKAERRLSGRWLGIPVSGRADLLLELEGGRRIVVDYKWSKSTRRQKQMEKGYELQASIYRALAATPRQGSAGCTDIVYFTMRDEVCLTDSAGTIGDSVRGWRPVQCEADHVSENAVARVVELLDELRTGKVRLNSETDRERFEKDWGLAPYALGASPLITLFAGPEEA